MSKGQKQFYQKIKFYRIIFISIILSPLLILNSKFTANKKTQEKLNKEAEIKFNKILNLRNLESFEEGMDKICNKGSEKLNNYYLTGVIDKIDDQINKEKKDESDENPEHVDALISLIKNVKGEATESGLSDDAMIYGKHILAISVFLAIAILSIPGWMICCSCCCCNCCCCCCCKSPKCKTPFYVITMLLYLLVIGVCVYGLIKSNSIFKGLADTECSILRFCDEVIEGETKGSKPKWVGITGIVTLLDTVENKINSLGNDKLIQLQRQNETIGRKKNEFEQSLENNSVKVTDETKNNIQIEGKNYRLDITSKQIYGVFDTQTKKGTPENSFIDIWYKEYSATAENSEKHIGEATEKFNKVLAPNEENDVIKSIDTIKNNVQDIGNSINDIKNGVADAIVEYSNYIDEYGKLAFKILYAILIVIVGSIALFMILLGFCSGKLCNCCCCFRFAFKVFIHILWNILAIFMIITFFIGFILSFVGTIGSDMVYVISFFISEDNLSKDEPALFGNEGKKLDKCFNGKGDILNDLGLNLDEIGSFDKLNEINEEIEIIEKKFTELKQNKGTYTTMMNQLNVRKDYTNLEFKIISNDGDSYILSNELSDLNSNNNVQENWSFSCNPSSETCKNPKDEKISDKYSYPSNAYSIGQRIDAITALVKIANGEESTNLENYKSLTEGLKTNYDEFLNAELNTLKIFKETIKGITGIFDDYMGQGGKVFDFVNCRFIGNNIQIILKNLKNNLGGDFYNVGICLLIAGCSMALSICFTILLVIIVNESVDKNKKDSK